MSEIVPTGEPTRFQWIVPNLCPYRQNSVLVEFSVRQNNMNVGEGLREESNRRGRVGKDQQARVTKTHHRQLGNRQRRHTIKIKTNF